MAYFGAYLSRTRATGDFPDHLCHGCPGSHPRSMVAQLFMPVRVPSWLSMAFAGLGRLLPSRDHPALAARQCKMLLPDSWSSRCPAPSLSPTIILDSDLRVPGLSEHSRDMCSRAILNAGPVPLCPQLLPAGLVDVSRIELSQQQTLAGWSDEDRATRLQQRRKLHS